MKKQKHLDHEKLIMSLLEHCSKQKYDDLYDNISSSLACPCPECVYRKMEDDVIPALCALANHPSILKYICICYLLGEGEKEKNPSRHKI